MDFQSVFLSIWAVSSGCLVVVVLFVNIDNYLIARKINIAANNSDPVAISIKDCKHRARYALIAVTVVAATLYITFSILLLRCVRGMAATLARITEQLTVLFESMKPSVLSEAPVAVRDRQEVECISEYQQFLVTLFSRHVEIADAQEKTGLANLWLREYSKFLPDDQSSDSDGNSGPSVFDKENSSHAARGERAEINPTVKIECGHSEPLALKGYEPACGVVSEEENIPFAGEDGCQKKQDRRFPLSLARDPVTSPVTTGRQREAALSQPSSDFRRRRATAVLVSFCDLSQRQFTDSASFLLGQIYALAQEYRGFLLRLHSDRILVCWNAFGEQKEHERLGLEFGQATVATFAGSTAGAVEELWVPVVVGVSGHLLAGRVTYGAAKPKMVYGECISVLYDVAELLYHHAVPKARRHCTWISVLPPRGRSVLLPFDAVMSKEGAIYVLYCVSRVSSSLDDASPTSQAVHVVTRAFQDFLKCDFQSVLAGLHNLNSDHAIPSIITDVAHRLQYLSGACVRHKTFYQLSVPRWTSHVPSGPTTTGDASTAAVAVPSLTLNGCLRMEQQLQGTRQKVRSTHELSSSADSTAAMQMKLSGRAQVPASSAMASHAWGVNATCEFRDDKGQMFRLSSVRLGGTRRSEVVLGLSVSTGALVAVKKTKFLLLSDREKRPYSTIRRLKDDGFIVTDDVNQVLKEVQVMSSLRDEGIVAYITALLSKHEQKLYLVMEYVSGGSLYDVMREYKGDGLPVDLARRYLREVLKSLQYLHHKHFIHCDVKPQNVLLTDRGQCKLSDFGISITRNARNSVPGTLSYVAPEAGSGELTEASDMFSFGVMLAEVLTGHVRVVPSLASLKRSEPPQMPVGNRGAELSEALEVFRQCTQAVPQQRPTAHETLGMPFFKKRAM